MGRWRLQTVGAHEAAANVMVDGVLLIGIRKGLFVKVEGEVEFFQFLVFVGDGVVEVELLVFVKERQGVAVVLYGFFRFA